MNNSIKILVFLVAIISIISLGIFGLTHLKQDDFHKAAVIFIVDASASNQANLTTDISLIKHLCSMLDPEDQIKILRVSEKSYLIYEGSAQSSAEIRNSMKEFTKLDTKEYGTAYGLSLQKAFTHAQNMQHDGYRPSIVVIGDLANEGNSENQIDWNKLPNEVSDLNSKVENLSMMFISSNVEKLDMVKELLSPILGEDRLIIASHTTATKASRKFLSAIGR